MGYTFKPTEIPEAFRITGLLNSPERVNPNLLKTSLTGTIVYFSRFLNHWTPKETMSQIESDVEQIISLVNN